MKITLIAVGKTDRPYLREGISLYCGRLVRYASFVMTEIPDVKLPASAGTDVVRRKEGEQILRLLRPSDDVVLLDPRGKERSSEEWAEHLQERFSRDGRDLVFVIGGPYGFSDEVYARADSMMSLSKMTFSHQMVRLLFVEQLYRAFTIMKGEPYHHK